MNINYKRKWWIVAAVLVALYFAPQAVRSFREAGAYQQQLQGLQARAQAARPGNAPATVASVPAASGSAQIPPAIQASKLAGVWSGQQADTNLELCQVQIEVRDKGQGEVNGYVKMLCYPTGAYYEAHPKTNVQETFMKAMTPMAAILSGTIKDGTVAFHVDKTIGTGLDGCALTSLTVTPFGTDEVAAEWQKTNCPGGQMTLSRSSK